MAEKAATQDGGPDVETIKANAAAGGVGTLVASIQYYLPSHAFLIFCAIVQQTCPSCDKTCSTVEYWSLVFGFATCIVGGVISKIQWGREKR